MTFPKKRFNPNYRYSTTRTDDKVLKSLAFKAPRFHYLRNLEKIGGLEKMSVDFGVCWMCWIRITGEGLNKWRREPYSENRAHQSNCPLCTQDKWSGRVWYPKRYLMYTEIGNPSRRDNIAPENREGIQPC
jgi:hypothetical protein